MARALPISIAALVISGCSQDWHNGRSDAGLDASSPDAADSGEGGPNADGGQDAGQPSACPGSCESGQQTACTTSCGSAGTGICSTTCAPPGAGQCTPPAEACNFLDDDCDGVVDPGMLAGLAPRVLTQTGAETTASTLSQVALLPHSTGGGWLLFRASDVLRRSVLDMAIEARELDREGKVMRELKLPQTERVTGFVADLAGDFLTLLVTYAPNPANDSAAKKVMVFRRTDLSLLAESTLGSNTDDDAARGEIDDDNDCVSYSIVRVRSFVDADKNLRLAFIHGETLAQATVLNNTTTKVCNAVAGKTELSTLTYRNDGSWSALKQVGLIKNLRSRDQQFARVPCTEDWLAWYTHDVQVTPHKNTPVWSSVRFDADGNVKSQNVDAVEADSLLDLRGSVENCQLGEQDMVLSYLAKGAEPQPTMLRRYTVDSVGALRRNLGDAVVPGGQALIMGGSLRADRVLLFGLSAFQPAVLDATRTLENIRKLELPALEDLAATLTFFGSGNGTNNLVSWGDLGGSVLGVMTKAYDSQALNAFRSPADSAPAVAALYPFGCSPAP